MIDEDVLDRVVRAIINPYRNLLNSEDQLTRLKRYLREGAPPDTIAFIREQYPFHCRST